MRQTIIDVDIDVETKWPPSAEAIINFIFLQGDSCSLSLINSLRPRDAYVLQ